MTVPAFMRALPNHRSGDPAEREHGGGLRAPSPLYFLEQERERGEGAGNDEISQENHAAIIPQNGALGEIL